MSIVRNWKRKLRLWTFFFGILTAFTAYYMFNLTTDFAHDTTASDRQFLSSGDTVFVIDTGIYRVFLEDVLPPVPISYHFTFTNVITGNVVYSAPPREVETYYISGVNGVLVATAHLEAGRYVIEFAPWHGSGNFIWHNDIFDGTYRFMALMGAASFALLLFFVSFVLFLRAYIKRIIKERGKAA